MICQVSAGLSGLMMKARTQAVMYSRAQGLSVPLEESADQGLTKDNDCDDEFKVRGPEY